MRPWEQNVVVWGVTLAGILAIALTFGSDRQAAARITPAQAVDQCTALIANDRSGQSLRRDIAIRGGSVHAFCTCVTAAVLAQGSFDAQSTAAANYWCLAYPEKWVGR